MACTVVLLTLSACGTAPSRVAVEHDQTDIVFGFTTPPPVKRAAVTPPPSASAPEDVFHPFTPKPFETFAPSGSNVACPTPAPDAPVSGSTGNAVKGRPKVGTYRYNTSGNTVLRGTKIPIQSPMQHYVRNVKSFQDAAGAGSSGDTFTYEAIERIQVNETTSGNWLFRYQVKAAAPGSDTEAGLVLKGIDVVDDHGKVTSTYFSALANGLLLAPFPIKAGAKWNSTSVDLAHNKTLQLSGQILTRRSVDVCGTLVQGWYLHTTINGAGESATVDEIVSPDNGGQVISTSIDGTFLGIDYDTANFHFGTLDPEPLPKELR